MYCVSYYIILENVYYSLGIYFRIYFLTPKFSNFIVGFQFFIGKTIFNKIKFFTYAYKIVTQLCCLQILNNNFSQPCDKCQLQYMYFTRPKLHIL